MKRLIMIMLTVFVMTAAAGCGAEDKTDNAQEYGSPVELLSAVYDSYEEDEKFPIGGGDSSNVTMDEPGVFDISNTEELDVTLGLPASQAENIDAAASMVHMMNANTFTCAAYHLTDAANADMFKDAVEENILSRQWICGMPDTMIIADAGSGYVVTAFGEASIMDTFKEKAEALGFKILSEEAVSDNF